MVSGFQKPAPKTFLVVWGLGSGTYEIGVLRSACFVCFACSDLRMSYRLHSLKGVCVGDYVGEYSRAS